MSAGVSTSGINWIALAMIGDTGKIIADAKKGLSESGVVLLDGDGEGATLPISLTLKKQVRNNTLTTKLSVTLMVRQLHK